jgi:hypothetical protein
VQNGTIPASRAQDVGVPGLLMVVKVEGRGTSV